MAQGPSPGMVDREMNRAARSAPESARGPVALSVWPAGLRRERAAAYIGVSPSKFDDWVTRGLMPKAKRLDSVVLWLRRELDDALDGLPDSETRPKEKGWGDLK